MRDDTLRAATAQLEGLVGPWQRSFVVLLNACEQLADLNFNALQNYTRLAVGPWRDALDIRDERSLREFFEKRQQARDELNRRWSEDARALARIGQELTEQAQRVLEGNLRMVADAARSTLEQGQRQVESAAGQAAQTSRQANRRVS